MAIDWNPAKNAELKERYGFGFERVLVALADGALLDERAHPNAEKYGHQRQLEHVLFNLGHILRP